MKNYNTFKKEFKDLTTSILANEKATIEEVAIWLDLNNIVSCKALIRLFRIISFYYHSAYDFQQPNPNFWCFSDVMFKNLFCVMFKTNSLDNAILKKNFMKFAKMVKDNCKRNIQHDQKDKASLNLYEVYAELVDRLEEKQNMKII